MDKHALFARYEAKGNESDFLAARRLYEQALDERPDPELLLGYGFLLECHGRNMIRRAGEQYERAIELDPRDDRAHYQLIQAKSALLDIDEMTARYEERLARAPGDIREHRFLATAYVRAHAYADAAKIIEAGLALIPDDRSLLASRGEVKAGTGDVEGALADWRCALELDADDIGPLYSTAFLLAREQRLEEAADAWRAIVDWCESRGLQLEAEWPRRELELLRGRPAGGEPARQ